MADFAPGLSRSVEDYLKAIYGICEQGGAASTTAIADALEVQPSSVTGMVKRLAESGLLEHMPYRGVRLTGKGSREALRVLRRHRILETYLCECLGYTWDDVHEEAERLEHAVSDTLVERMAEAMHFPSHDPHGAPIPTSGGDIEEPAGVPLAEAPTGSMMRIRAVRDEDAGGLRSLESEGLMPGVRIRIEAGRGAGESALIVSLPDLDDVRRTVPQELAGRIFVVADIS